LVDGKYNKPTIFFINMIERRPSSEIRVVHPSFFGFHDAFLRGLKEELSSVGRWNVDIARFKDGSPWLHVIPHVGTEKDLDILPARCAYVPFWLVPPLADSLYNVLQIGNALTHQERNRPPLVERAIGICPHAAFRQDRDSNVPEDKIRRVGEAIDAEVIAESLAANGLRELVLFDPHGHEVLNYLNKAGISYVPLTAIPLFVDYLINRNLITENSAVVSLDKGNLQRCLHLLKLLNLDPLSQLVVLDKRRTGHNQVGDSELLWGNPDCKDIIISDDILDTGSSIGKTCQALKKFGCGRIVVMVTHGVLSYPARENLIHLLDQKIIDEIVLTDSLPQAIYTLEGIEDITILSAVPIMAEVAKAVALSSVEEVRNNKEIAPFILQLDDKEAVWNQFIQDMAARRVERVSQVPIDHTVKNFIVDVPPSTAQ